MMVKRCPYCGEPEFPPCEKCGGPLYQNGTRHLKSTREIKKSFVCKACGKGHSAYIKDGVWMFERRKKGRPKLPLPS